MTRHSREDALTEPQFERLWSAAKNLDERWRLECEFVVVVAGRLGLRAGELCHMTESWINWDRRQIEIPRHDPCGFGRHGGVCGYCRDRAAVAVECNDDLTMDEALAQRWEPKTDQGHRVVPFDFDSKVERVVEEFFIFHDEFEPSRSAVNRRVDRALEAAGFPASMCYPHALRATAATWHAYGSVNPTALQSLMGWAELSTAQKYIRLSGSQTQEALRKAHESD